MQNELEITLSLYALGAALLAYTFYRAITISHRRGYRAGTAAAEAAHSTLILAQTQATARATQQHVEAQEKLETANAVIELLRADKAQLVAVTPQEIGVMIKAANLLDLARRTWEPMKGVEPTARKASRVHEQLARLNERLSTNAIRSLKAEQEEAA